MLPEMTAPLGWGILGTGNIARQFTAGLTASPRARLVAIGSRSAYSARLFAADHRACGTQGDYDAVLADREVDVVYIALPNTLHHEWTIKALRAGKHVLCEKPIAASAAQAEEMFDVAQRHGRVLVEAFMYRAHPLTQAVLKSVRNGAIGQVRMIRTSFCFRTGRTNGNIRFDPALGGGSLMDIGCYCINLSRLVAGEEPAAMHATASLHPTGIDEITVGTLAFPSGILASFTCGMGVHADNSAYICGTDGYIEIPVPWKPPRDNATFTIARNTPPRMDQARSASPAPPPREMFHIDAGMDLYGIEAEAFASILLDGAAPFVSAQDSIGNMKVLDELRRQVGVATDNWQLTT